MAYVLQNSSAEFFSLNPWPSFTDEEVNAVSAVLRSNRVNYWTGSECKSFEDDFAEWSGCGKAIALANGTVALDLALLALNIGASNGGKSTDQVIVTPRSFIASVSTVVNAGAIPVFADVDLNSGNISAETIRKVLSPNTRAIIAVHVAGWPCEMDSLCDLARENEIWLIEDCAQAHGAQYQGRSVGSYGHIGTWSFCQDKIMTLGGEGGMVTTNDEGLWEKMWSFKDHGKSWAAVNEIPTSSGYRWIHGSFGTNWRMTEIQAAIGRIQLKRLAEWHNIRTSNANTLQSNLMEFAGDNGPIRIPDFDKRFGSDTGTNAPSRHAYYKYYVYVRPENLGPGWNRDRIVDEIMAKGIPCFQGICPEIYLEKAFDSTDWRPKNRLQNAKELGETSVMFLVHPTISEETMNSVSKIIASVIGNASR